MAKYIVELKKNETLYKATTRESDGTAYVCSAIGTLYTAPDLEKVKADAYSEGLKDGKAVTLANEQNNAFNNGYKKCLEDHREQVKKDYDDWYEKGLNDAWEAARRITDIPYNEGEKIFGVTGWHIITKCTAAEVIAKIKAWEEKKQEIKVGDEVDAPFGKAVVLDVTDNAVFYLYAAGGTGWEEPEYVRKHKTGRNIAEMTTALEKLRGKQE